MQPKVDSVSPVPVPGPVPVLIVGAGPTGLTLACELWRRGVPARLIEAGEGPAIGSRGKGTQPRSLEIFDDLGIVERVLQGGRFHMPMRIYDEKGQHTDRDMHEGNTARPDAPYGSTLLTPQFRVEEALRDRLESLGGGVEFGWRLVRFEQDAAGVTAHLQHGEREVTVRTSYLVGCDGGKSTTRHAMGVSFLGETLEQIRVLLGDVEVEGLDREHWHAFRHPDGFLALCPLPGTNVFQFQASIGEAYKSQPSLKCFQEVVEERTGRKDIRLSNPTWLSLWRANVRMVDHYRQGRVFLAGDAAHVHIPAGAQGMNTGIQDAYNLGWKLAAVLSGTGVEPALLDSYEAERLPVAAWVLGISTRIAGQAFTQQQGVFTPRSGETLQLGIGYRDSPLSRELRSSPGKVQAGDRAPDAPGLTQGGREQRLFDLFRGPHCTLLAFGEGWDPLIDDLTRRFSKHVRCAVIRSATDPPSASARGFIDREGHARRGYDLERPTLFLIRPDGHIAVATEDRDAAPLITWLEQTIAAPAG